AADKDGWVQLFNGQDLTGLQVDGSWRGQDGGLVSNASKSRGHTGKSFGNLRCRGELKVAARAMGIISARAEGTRGAGILVGKVDPSLGGHTKSGSVYQNILSKSEVVARWTRELVKPDTWFVAEFTVRGNEVVVWIDGTETARQTLADLPTVGAIA